LARPVSIWQNRPATAGTDGVHLSNSGAAMTRFKTGDAVRLRRGGLQMVVVGTTRAGGSCAWECVACWWVDPDGRVWSEPFPPEALEFDDGDPAPDTTAPPAARKRAAG
jgi:uncharacterized protein YodC (DUF2158 family)